MKRRFKRFHRKNLFRALIEEKIPGSSLAIDLSDGIQQEQLPFFNEQFYKRQEVIKFLTSEGESQLYSIRFRLIHIISKECYHNVTNLFEVMFNITPKLFYGIVRLTMETLAKLSLMTPTDPDILALPGIDPVLLNWMSKNPCNYYNMVSAFVLDGSYGISRVRLCFKDAPNEGNILSFFICLQIINNIIDEAESDFFERNIISNIPIISPHLSVPMVFEPGESSIVEFGSYNNREIVELFARDIHRIYCDYQIECLSKYTCGKWESSGRILIDAFENLKSYIFPDQDLVSLIIAYLAPYSETGYGLDLYAGKLPLLYYAENVMFLTQIINKNAQLSGKNLKVL